MQALQQLGEFTQEITMSSREIAELCNKQHKHVCRDIRDMFKELKRDESRFGRIYIDQQKREQKEYVLPKDLTLNLVSGYSRILRQRIIERLIELESLSPSEMLFRQAALMVNLERAQKKQGEQVSVNTHDIKVLKDKVAVLEPGTGLVTITAYCRQHGYKWPLEACKKLGQCAAALCRSRHINLCKVPDERYYEVNSYPIEILDELVGHGVPFVVQSGVRNKRES